VRFRAPCRQRHTQQSHRSKTSTSIILAAGTSLGIVTFSCSSSTHGRGRSLQSLIPQQRRGGDTAAESWNRPTPAIHLEREPTAGVRRVLASTKPELGILGRNACPDIRLRLGPALRALAGEVLRVFPHRLPVIPVPRNPPEASRAGAALELGGYFLFRCQRIRCGCRRSRSVSRHRTWCRWLPRRRRV
jgi:hypothetical protein